MAPDLVEPAHLWVPDEYDPERTLGPQVAAVATLAGYAPDLEQRLLLDLAFALDKDGKSLAFEVVIVAPRQNLKTGFLKQYALGQLFVRHEELVPWSAHEFSTAAEAVTDLEALIDGSDALRSRVQFTSRGGVAKRGAVPEVKLTKKAGGGRIIFRTRTAGGGRGLSGNKVILDEAYALQAAQTGALYPIMLAKPDPQVVAASSACRPESAVLWDMVKRGRAGGHRRMVYAEWCAPEPAVACDAGDECSHDRGVPGCGCDKPEVVRLAHTAIARGRIQLQTVMDLRASLPPEEYCREVMGWHDEVIDGSQLLDFSGWPALEDADAEMVEPVFFGVAVAPDRTRAAIGAAGPAVDSERTLLELVDRRAGVGWLVERCKELHDRYPGSRFVIDNHGPAASILEDLREAAVPVDEMATADVATAAEQFVDGIKEAVYVHGPQREIDDAMLVAQPRPVGDGRVAIGRRASGGDVTALEAIAYAAWGAAGASNYDVLESVY